MRRATWVFLRAYLLIALLVIATGFLLESLLEQRELEAEQQHESELILGNFLLVEEALPALSSGDLAQFASEKLQMPATLHSLMDFEGLGERFRKLQDGEVIFLYDDNDQAIFYRRLSQGDLVLALGPLPPVDNERSQWVVPLFYSLLALAVFLWIRPLSRDLEGLQKTARAFGDQDFSTRASIPGRSWLSPLGQAFNAMAQRIQSLLQSHQDLTHAVSHELRTPLARIRFSLEMLDGASRDDCQRHIGSMKADVDELNNLIEEMLGYAELDQENLRPKKESLAIGPWLAAYARNYNTGGSQIALKVTELSPPESVAAADEGMLGRALDNLVSNALRYADKSVELSVEMENGLCMLRVRDDGPGIPLRQREAVLSAYTRLEPQAGEVKRGFGLGLAIVKRIMELHDGEVIIETAPGGGADISLNWPS
jgi:signal transduction histidine kinase